MVKTSYKTEPDIDEILKDEAFIGKYGSQAAAVRMGLRKLYQQYQGTQSQPAQEEPKPEKKEELPVQEAKIVVRGRIVG